MGLFDDLDLGPTVDTVSEPQKIFHALPKRAPRYEYLRNVQGQVLEKWHSRKDEKDTVIKMNTGGGKTVVGLLVLKSCLNDQQGPAVYVCPDHYLCDQVIAEARDLGIETAEDPRSPHFLNGRAILVIPIDTLFNGKSKFGVGGEGSKLEIGSVIIDDAHACIARAEQKFTVTIPRTSPLYTELLDLFRADLKQQSIATAAEIDQGERRALARVPYWAWQDKMEIVARLLVSNSNLKEVEWEWPLLRDCLSQCLCHMHATAIEIAPRCLPVSSIPSFGKARRRIYMTATLADDSVLVSSFNAESSAVANPIAPASGSDIGERLILIPQEINTSVTDSDIRDFAAAQAKTRNVVVIVPSFKRAEFWRPVASKIIDADTIVEGVETLRQSSGNFVVMVNRYDGVDLPNDSCRLLIVDGLPDARRLVDRYEQSILESSKRFRTNQIQRIEQGMGRGIRAGNDYCVVMLMGSQLLASLYAAGAVEFFSASTRAQLNLSRKLAKKIEEKGLDEMASVVEAVLQRDPQWVAAAKNAVIEVNNPSSIEVDAISVAQREAFEASRRGRPDKAEAALRSAYQESESDTLKGWLLEQVAEVVHPTDKVQSQSILAGAHERNAMTLKPLRGVTYPRVDTAGMDQARQAAHYLTDKYKNSNALVIGMRGVLDRLRFGDDTAEDVEEALKELGLHLGFRSQRPEKLGIAYLDVLWGIGENHYLLLPCKSEATSPTISKAYTDQVSGSLTWFGETYDHTCKATAVIVHPSNIVDKAGTAPPGMRVLNAERLAVLKTAAENFVVAVKDKLDDVGSVRAALSYEKLLGSQIVGGHSALPKVQI
ncbi:DEAD/DEAH box helicase family protein [Brevundimonas sp.]|uniref:DEAD/DEAH box helicase family protein n=1 Tax=Brevundimonas sp. TaxID=1871086 RepID=UPI0035B2CE11